MLEQVAKQTGRMPDVLKNRPEVDPEWVWYLGAFYDLHSCRQAGMAANPLPASEIFYYCLLMGVVDRPLFFRVIKALDGVYMEHLAKEQERRDNAHEAKLKASSASRPSRRR